MTKSKVTPVVVRMPPELLARVDTYYARLRASSPEGLSLTRSDALRAVLAVGLSKLEEGVKK